MKICIIISNSFLIAKFITIYISISLYIQNENVIIFSNLWYRNFILFRHKHSASILYKQYLFIWYSNLQISCFVWVMKSVHLTSTLTYLRASNTAQFRAFKKCASDHFPKKNPTLICHLHEILITDWGFFFKIAG